MAEWRTIPGYPGYVINMETSVMVSPLGKICKRLSDHGLENRYHVRNGSGKATTKRITLLLEMAQEHGEVVPDPIKIKEEDAAYVPISRRRCHDCGKPTSDYRCADCLFKWRKKHGVSMNVDDDTFDMYNGSVRARGKGHAHQE